LSVHPAGGGNQEGLRLSCQGEGNTQKPLQIHPSDCFGQVVFGVTRNELSTVRIFGQYGIASPIDPQAAFSTSRPKKRIRREDCRRQQVLHIVAPFTVWTNCLDLEATNQTPAKTAEVISPVSRWCWRSPGSFEAGELVLPALGGLQFWLLLPLINFEWAG